MSYHKDSYGSGLAVFALVLVLIGAFLAVKGVVFVISTFAKYSKHRALWIALAGCVVLSVPGTLLSVLVYPLYILLLIVGIAGLLITCLVVDMRNRETLIRENVNLIDEVLHTSWWSSEDVPLAA